MRATEKHCSEGRLVTLERCQTRERVVMKQTRDSKKRITCSVTLVSCPVAGCVARKQTCGSRKETRENVVRVTRHAVSRT
ncbi:hypothetical protein NDU88_007532 [Pleurodeles waltl]|uniref:Uncharacterized protein n=1 Tax=Pleurodeles waltl TaxID=8319 RepID=A0AAV7N6L6_PLEWA|nr:hypothetical protein NDU88_007532 [Pleurodeles waltl]